MQTKPQILMFSNGRWDISSFTACFVDKFEKWKYTESDIYTCTGFRYFPCWREKYWKKCFKRDHLLIIKLWKSFKIAHLYKRLISSISDKEQNKLHKLFFFILFFVYVYAQVPGATRMHAPRGSDHWGLEFYKWPWASRLVLGTEPSTTARMGGALNCSPTPT